MLFLFLNLAYLIVTQVWCLSMKVKEANAGVSMMSDGEFLDFYAASILCKLTWLIVIALRQLIIYFRRTFNRRTYGMSSGVSRQSPRETMLTKIVLVRSKYASVLKMPSCALVIVAQISHHPVAHRKKPCTDLGFLTMFFFFEHPITHFPLILSIAIHTVLILNYHPALF